LPVAKIEFPENETAFLVSGIFALPYLLCWLLIIKSPGIDIFFTSIIISHETKIVRSILLFSDSTKKSRHFGDPW
jgi:hypothetical protein